jgi:adenylate cyclase
MSTGDLKRKLAAILSADVKGYSRLMGEDEEWTVRTLNTHKAVIRNLVSQHRGRVVDAPGDNVLAEFGSVVDAVQCAVEIQQVLKAKNALLPETRRMEFRIGINLGDVIEEEDRIYGDGVNIAARLEGLADPGGICISETAYLQIENKLPLQYDFMGEHEVKNIARPVKAYRALLEDEAKAKAKAEAEGKGKAEAETNEAARRKAQGARGRKVTLGILGAVMIAVGAVALWHFVISPKPRPVEKADPKKMALPLPDLPSIAVLPFANMSEDPKQESLCDGITEEIITALSKAPHLFVISRQSAFSYKGKPVKVKQVSEELGVKYVLEGSVQKSGDRIRITAQLIDALTGRHVWAERYERELRDIFALQDEITINILTAIRVKLTEGQKLSGSEKYFRGKQGLDCYLKMLEARKYLQGHNVEDTRTGGRITEEMMAMCPDNPMAHAFRAYSYWMAYWLGPVQGRRESIEKGIEMAHEALAMDDSIAGAHSLLGMFYSLRREFEKAIAEGERAVALDPGGATAHMFYAMSLYYVGRSEEAIPLFQRAIRLDPVGTTGVYLNFGHALRVLGRYEEALSAYGKSIQREPKNIFAHLGMTATYIQMGRDQEARSEADEVRRINPKFSLDSLARSLPFKDQSMIDSYIGALRKAGLPD